MCLRNDTYELRLRLTDNTADWKNQPLIPTTAHITEWTNSLRNNKHNPSETSPAIHTDNIPPTEQMNSTDPKALLPTLL